MRHSVNIKQKFPSLKRKSSVPVLIPNEKVNIPVTLKYQEMIKFTRGKISHQEQEKQAELKAERERK